MIIVQQLKTQNLFSSILLPGLFLIIPSISFTSEPDYPDQQGDIISSINNKLYNYHAVNKYHSLQVTRLGSI
jgi:hypothetical protein